MRGAFTLCTVFEYIWALHSPGHGKCEFYVPYPGSIYYLEFSTLPGFLEIYIHSIPLTTHVSTLSAHANQKQQLYVGLD